MKHQVFFAAPFKVGHQGRVSAGIPSSGMASDTCGSVSVTMLWKTVRESRIVTPKNRSKKVKNWSQYGYTDGEPVWPPLIP